MPLLAALLTVTTAARARHIPVVAVAVSRASAIVGFRPPPVSAAPRPRRAAATSRSTSASADERGPTGRHGLRRRPDTTSFRTADVRGVVVWAALVESLVGPVLLALASRRRRDVVVAALLPAVVSAAATGISWPTDWGTRSPDSDFTNTGVLLLLTLVTTATGAVGITVALLARTAWRRLRQSDAER